ncbi:MAG TPA: purine/cytosine permease, partial [Actinomycetes bacterium]|nr:purine/cytosine permease [Actinomycetes bacterium]
AALAWVAGSIFGLLAINTTLYKGPLADLADGVDVSFLGSFAIAGILYLVLEAVVPSTSKGVTTNAALASADDS